MCGALATRFASAVEQRAGVVEPLLDVHRARGLAQHHAHLLGDVHEQAVEDLEPQRVGRLGRERRAPARCGAIRRSSKAAGALDRGLPSRPRSSRSSRARSAAPARDDRVPRAVPPARCSGTSCQVPSTRRRSRSGVRCARRARLNRRACRAVGPQARRAAGPDGAAAASPSPLRLRSAASTRPVAITIRAASSRIRTVARGPRGMPARRPAPAATATSSAGVGAREPQLRRCAERSMSAAAMPCRSSSARAARSSSARAAMARAHARGVERALRRCAGACSAGARGRCPRPTARRRADAAAACRCRAASATAQACWPAAPPNGTSVNRCGVLAVAQRKLADRVRHLRDGHLEERRGQRLDRVVAGRRRPRLPRRSPARRALRRLRIERRVARAVRTRAESARRGCGRAPRCSR